MNEKSISFCFKSHRCKRQGQNADGSSDCRPDIVIIIFIKNAGKLSEFAQKCAETFWRGRNLCA
jgi:hypothetical protein